MTLPVVVNQIELLARALLAQISPVTGERGTGTAIATALTDDVIVKRNSYLLPILGAARGSQGGRIRDDQPFKVGPNPATSDGSWTVTSAGTQIDLISNMGGKNQNIPRDTRLRWEPPIPGLEAEVVTDVEFTGGTKGMVGQAHFYEDLDTGQKGLDTAAAKLKNFPALMLTWENDLPAEGQTTGLQQAGTRLTRGNRAFRETFSLYIIGGKEASDPARRRGLMNVMEIVTGLLTDRQCNDDGEALSSIGALEILGRSPFERSPTSYIYLVQLRVVRTLSRIDQRTFKLWLTTRYRDQIPADAPLTEVDRVDVTIDMT